MSPPFIHTDPFGLLKFSSFGSFQLRAVATPAVLCCGVQGNLGYRLSTTQTSPSAVQLQSYANVHVLRGFGLSAGRGAQLGFAFADVEELPQLRELALDTPWFGVSFLFRKGGFPIPVGGAIGGSSWGGSATASHPDWPGKEWTLLWGVPGAGNAILLGRRKGWWILGREPAKLVIEAPGSGTSALPQVMRTFEKFGTATQELKSQALSAALPARKLLGWEYSKKHCIPCTIELVPPRAAQGERLVVTCDVSLVRGRKRPFGYVWSSVTLVIGIIALIIGRGMTLDGLAIFLVAFLGPWVILQLAFFLDCFRIRTKILRLIRSVR